MNLLWQSQVVWDRLTMWLGVVHFAPLFVNLKWNNYFFSFPSAFFGAVLCLIISSTFYDFYTFENRKSALISNTHLTKIKHSSQSNFEFEILDKKIEVFLAFSFYTNGKKLLSVQKQNSAGMIGCMNGIRALSAVWVVLFHSFMVYKSIPIHNIQTYSSVSFSAI